jgi:UDPglucose 6-dehydrogenase
MKKPIEHVSMIGLGKLGLPTLAFFASRGCYAVGYDANHGLVKELEKNEVELTEPDLAEMMQKHYKRIQFTDNMFAAVHATNITFVIVPTPSQKSGQFSNDYVRDVAMKIGSILKEKNKWHLVVLVSTVMPGSTRKHFVEVIERHSGKKCGKGFGVCYSPEFIALGSVLYNLAHPDFMLIGQYDERSGKTLEEFHSKILPKTVLKRRMTLENAELAKIAVNTFVTTKISYANMLAAICEKMPFPGIDVSVITNAIGLDSRIGLRYLSAGLGFGGPCFPRDNKALSIFAKKSGLKAHIALATDAENRFQAKRLVKRIADFTAKWSPRKNEVAVLGLSYKKDTHIVEESQGIEIVKEIMSREGFTNWVISAFDTLETMKASRKVLGIGPFYCESIEEVVKDADVVVIAVADKRFVPKWSSLKNKGEGVLIVDPWRIINETVLPKGASYLTVGKPVSYGK